MAPLSLLFISDTHLPTRARVLPDEVWAAVDAADVVFHAGDWVDVATLDLLSARAARLVGVYGNNDGPELRHRLPEVARVTLDGLRFAVIHETGSATGRESRADLAFPREPAGEAGTDVLVFGHSHIPWNTVTPAGLLLLNPGSPTDRRRQPNATYLTATLTDSVVHTLTLHPLPARPRR